MYVISSSKKSHCLRDYSINNIIIETVLEIHDLDILYDGKITFVRHIDYIISKAYSMFGFMMRV